jgi:hypothetical protein
MYDRRKLHGSKYGDVDSEDNVRYHSTFAARALAREPAREPRRTSRAARRLFAVLGSRRCGAHHAHGSAARQATLTTNMFPRAASCTQRDFRSTSSADEERRPPVGARRVASPSFPAQGMDTALSSLVAPPFSPHSPVRSPLRSAPQPAGDRAASPRPSLRCASARAIHPLRSRLSRRSLSAAPSRRSRHSAKSTCSPRSAPATCAVSQHCATPLTPHIPLSPTPFRLRSWTSPPTSRPPPAKTPSAPIPARCVT